MTNYSAIYYKNLDGKAETLVIPTIQSLSIPDSTTIASKPTVTGEYRNQYVIRNTLRVSFTAWLENGKFGEETVDVSEAIDQLEYLRKNRIKFNLSTTQEAEESRFLADLVIENISYSREADHRGRVVCSVNCIQIKLINLTWKYASAIEIFGHNIFVDPATAASNVNMSFVSGVTDTDFELSDNIVGASLTKLGDISGYTDMPVTRHIRSAIQDKVNLTDDSYYYKLASPIDLSVGSRSYTCACSFQSRYGLGSDQEDYTVNLTSIVVNTTKKNATIVENFPVGIFLSDSWAAGLYNSQKISTANSYNQQRIRNSEPTCAYPYDFADTYKEFTVPQTLEYITGMGDLTEYLVQCVNNNKFTEDLNAATTGSVVVKDGNVYTYKISERYSYNATFHGKTSIKPKSPSGALDVKTFSFYAKPIVSNESQQSIWDGLAKPKLYVVFVTLGTLLQIYLFSASLFNQNHISSSA